MRLTPLSKVLIILFLSGIGFGIYKGLGNKIIDTIAPSAQTSNSVIPSKADLPSLSESSSNENGVEKIALPNSEIGCADKPEIRFLLWAWNSQMGLMFANGGPQSTKGSLMCNKDVNLKLIREDDVSKMQEALVTFATKLSKGEKNPSEGAHYVAIMGDGSATFLKGLNDTLSRLGSEYRAKVIGSAGYSRGEDKFMGPSEWKKNPITSRGGVVSGYLRDGDWNIAQKWLGDNGLCNNPDEKTYDPDCLNWISASSYIDAAEKYVANYCEDRPVVKKGNKTGETKNICVQAVVTWTPGDVTVAQKKGGIVNIVSTKEYSSQMPNTIIGIDKWMKNNRPKVEGMLSAIFEGGDQVKNHQSALRKASEVSNIVYHEAGTDPSYWEKYYKINVEKDKKGIEVELGGSSVNNLADNIYLFGLKEGSANLFAATYTVFADIVKAQYPELLPSYYPVRDIVDTSYIVALNKSTPQITQAEVPKFEQQEKIKEVVSRKAWNINFESGKSEFAGSSMKDLETIKRDLLVANNTLVEIHGHTDAQGLPQSNLALSEERAFAVKNWLEQNAPENFPSGRLRVFAHGSENPLAPNSTTEGRAKNRRVEIVIGTSSNN